MGRRWVREETEGEEGGERESDTAATAVTTGAVRSYGRDKGGASPIKAMLFGLLTNKDDINI
jgi:hypothetical protein